jgi:hypothetical protein
MDKKKTISDFIASAAISKDCLHEFTQRQTCKESAMGA